MQLVFSAYTLDTDRRELRLGSECIAVEPQVFDLLFYLVQNRNLVVARTISSLPSGVAGSCRIRP